MIEVKGLHKSFGDAHILKGIDAYFEKGDFSHALASLTMAMDLGATGAELYTMLGLANQ